MSFTVDEEKLAKDLGLPRKTVADFKKKLVRGTDYEFVDRRITYTTAGAQKMAVLCGVDWAPCVAEAAIQVKTRGGGNYQTAGIVGDSSKSAFVTVIYKKNRKYMEAEKDGERIVIRVRTNENFVPKNSTFLGTEITAEKLVHSGGALWDFIGRLPRARGVW